MNSLLGIKLGQTQQFDEEGNRMPVTLIQAGPCWITQIHEGSKQRVQLGFGSTKRLSKAQEGHMKKAGLQNKPRFLREVDAIGDSELTMGKEIHVNDVFAVGDSVQITGTSKGRGFTGVVKRHGFKGGPRTHGQSDRERAPGSIGQTTTPGRVYRGKRMAGRSGNETITIKGLKVVAVDSEKHILTVKGVIPGSKNGLVIIQKKS